MIFKKRYLSLFLCTVSIVLSHLTPDFYAGVNKKLRNYNHLSMDQKMNLDKNLTMEYQIVKNLSRSEIKHRAFLSSEDRSELSVLPIKKSKSVPLEYGHILKKTVPSHQITWQTHIRLKRKQNIAPNSRSVDKILVKPIPQKVQNKERPTSQRNNVAFNPEGSLGKSSFKTGQKYSQIINHNEQKYIASPILSRKSKEAIEYSKKIKDLNVKNLKKEPPANTKLPVHSQERQQENVSKELNKINNLSIKLDAQTGFSNSSNAAVKPLIEAGKNSQDFMRKPNESANDQKTVIGIVKITCKTRPGKVVTRLKRDTQKNGKQSSYLRLVVPVDDNEDILLYRLHEEGFGGVGEAKLLSVLEEHYSPKTDDVDVKPYELKEEVEKIRTEQNPKDTIETLANKIFNLSNIVNREIDTDKYGQKPLYISGLPRPSSGWKEIFLENFDSNWFNGNDESIPIDTLEQNQLLEVTDVKSSHKITVRPKVINSTALEANVLETNEPVLYAKVVDTNQGLKEDCVPSTNIKNHIFVKTEPFKIFSKPNRPKSENSRNVLLTPKIRWKNNQPPLRQPNKFPKINVRGNHAYRKYSDSAKHPQEKSPFFGRRWTDSTPNEKASQFYRSKGPILSSSQETKRFFHK
ncbi:uncharacterized protein LOC136026149 [Artemia franciscana]|uniref:uncharacterized protein LOC136026149 n=1 Tax=Artemia franciscana TaxID=6661 RepID=UPI0032DAD168